MDLPVQTWTKDNWEDAYKAIQNTVTLTIKTGEGRVESIAGYLELVDVEEVQEESDGDGEDAIHVVTLGFNFRGSGRPRYVRALEDGWELSILRATMIL